MLALLGAHHILHVSRIRVKLLFEHFLARKLHSRIITPSLMDTHTFSDNLQYTTEAEDCVIHIPASSDPVSARHLKDAVSLRSTGNKAILSFQSFCKTALVKDGSK